MSDPQTIETHFVEERRYPPTPEFAAQANAQPEIYERDFDEFWETEGRELVSWAEPFTKLYEWELPYAKWYLGGTLNVSYNCVDRHVEEGRGERVAFHWEGEPGDTREISYADLQREVVRFANALKELGVKKGTAVAIYMGMVPELPVAMLACTRLGAPHTVVFGGFSADSLSDRANDMGCEVLITQDEAWRRGSTVPLKRTADEAMAAAPGIKTRPGRPPHRERGADAGGARRLAARARRLRRPGELPARADGRRGSPLPDVHVRHDREAEGDRAHDGRLPRRRRRDPPLHLRPQAGDGRLLVRGRHRLDHRPQLHRLRAALQRRDLGALRGHARLPGQGSVVVDRRALRRHDPLHRAHCDPRPHEVGAGARAEARSLFAAAARYGRRADQPGGVDVVPGARRRRPLSGRRHVVADRDRDGADHAAAGGDDDEAGLGDEAVSRASTSASSTRPARKSGRAAAATSS